MIRPISRGPIPGAASGTTGATTGGTPDDARLRSAARQLEGVFTQQLFKAMRETVPEDQGAIGGSSAQEMFTGLLDEHLSSDPHAASTHGIGEAIYHHLLRSRGVAPTPSADPAAPVSTALTSTARGSTAPASAAAAASRAPVVTPPLRGASLRKTS